MASSQMELRENSKMQTRYKILIAFTLIVFLPSLLIEFLAPRPYMQWASAITIPCVLCYGSFRAMSMIANENTAFKILPYVFAGSFTISPFLVFATGEVQVISFIVGLSLFIPLMFCWLVAMVMNSIKTFPKRTRRKLEVVQQKAMTNSLEGSAKPRCTICKEESQYDVCLSCEKTFQGERHRVRAQILRAKQAGVPATLTLAEWLEQLQTFHNHCAYCHRPFQLIEHYIPISQGGGTTKENCVPACFKCNAKKSGKHPEK